MAERETAFRNVKSEVKMENLMSALHDAEITITVQCYEYKIDQYTRTTGQLTHKLTATCNVRRIVKLEANVNTNVRITV